jgi:dTMP kinase
VSERKRSTPQRGRFITLEGPDGSGKTLVAALVSEALAARGIVARLTREPGGTALGERVRAILLEHAPDDPPLAPRADALLFAAARAQHVAQVIDPAVARGELVLCARYADSTLAYQGYGLGLPLDELRELQRFATGGRRPDLTILLDIPVEVGLARKQHDEQTRFEAAFDMAYHRRVRAGFLALAAAEPGRFVIVDATAPIDAVVAATLEAILGRLA